MDLALWLRYPERDRTTMGLPGLYQAESPPANFHQISRYSECHGTRFLIHHICAPVGEKTKSAAERKVDVKAASHDMKLKVSTLIALGLWQNFTL